MARLLLLLLPLFAHGYSAATHSRGRGVRCAGPSRTAIRASEDPRPTGPSEKIQPPPLYEADTSGGMSQPAPDEDAPVVLGARILGAGFGGVTGNALFSSLQNIGFTSCTPFNKAGCQSLIREQQLQQQLQKQAQQVASLVSVPPMSASEFDPSVLVDSSTSSLDLVGFSVVADGGGAVPLLATLLFAVFGAIAFEVLATNKVPPIPDPFLGGVWSSLHALVRGPSKATGIAATSVFEAIKSAVTEQQDTQ